MKSVMRFSKKGKLRPRFISLFEILERVGEVGYRLSPPPNLSFLLSMFNVYAVVIYSRWFSCDIY